MDPIELIITLDEEGVISGSAKVKEAVGGIGDAAENTGQQTEDAGKKGEGGMHLMGFAAAKLGEDLGIPFRASHVLGTRVAQMAGSEFPALIGAFTTVAIGGAIVVGVVENLIEAHKKHEEELAKETQALEGQLSEMDKLRLKTLEVIAAMQVQSTRASQLLFDTLPEKIETAQKKVQDLTKDYQKLIGPQQQAPDGLMSFMTGEAISKTGPAWDKFNNQVAIARDRLLNADADLQKLLADQQALGGKGKKSTTEESSPFWQVDDQKKWLVSQQTDYITARGYQIAFDQARVEQATATGATLADVQNMQLAVFDETTSKMILAAKNRDEAEATLAARSIQRETLTTQQKKALYQQDMQNKATMSQGISQVMDQLYTLSGQKMMAFFYLSRAAAASEAFVNYQLAAAKAVGQTGLFGLDMSAYFETMSIVAPALIMAQAFAGGAGSASASGTYPASTTGLPNSNTGPGATTQQQAPQQVTIVVQSLDPSSVNWDRLMEEQIIPALNAASDRNVQINIGG
jgi:hypothetical protein